MKNWKPVDIIVLILTIFVCVNVSLAIIKPIFGIQPIPVDVAKIISNTIVANIAIISIYVGAKLNIKKD